MLLAVRREAAQPALAQPRWPSLTLAFPGTSPITSEGPYLQISGRRSFPFAEISQVTLQPDPALPGALSTLWGWPGHLGARLQK